MKKCKFFDHSKITWFLSSKCLFYRKVGLKDIWNFWPESSVNHFGKMQFFDHSEMTFLSSNKTHFEKTTSSDEKPRSVLQKKEAWKKFGISNQNNWLTPLEKCKFFDYSKMTFMGSKKPPFGKTTSSDDKKEVSNTEK